MSDLDRSFRIRLLDADSIAANPNQPRRVFAEDALNSLADSISRFGILQPLTVRAVDGGYELIAGERRLRAAKIAGLKELPCIVTEADDRRSAELALIENLQREELNIFEQAGAIASLIDIYELTQEQVAQRLSTSQSYVANKLRILKLSSAEREIILDASLTERHARSLLRIKDDALRMEALKHIAARKLNVAAAELYIDRLVEADRLERQKANRRIVIRDIRVFYNTVDKAVELMRESGIDVRSDRRDLDDGAGGVEMVITIRNERVKA